MLSSYAWGVLGDADIDGDADALRVGETDGLTEKEGLTLGDSLPTDGETLGLTEGETEKLGLTEKLLLIEGGAEKLWLIDGDGEKLPEIEGETEKETT